MTDTKKKILQARTKQNILEQLKELGGGATDEVGGLLKDTSEDFFKELLGFKNPQPKRSGELSMGQTLEMNEVLSGKEEENEKLRSQISLERRLSADEKQLSQEKTNELKVQLQALTSEVAKVAASTQNLAEATQVAMIQAPAEPGIYHVMFFEKVLIFLQSFYLARILFEKSDLESLQLLRDE